MLFYVDTGALMNGRVRFARKRSIPTSSRPYRAKTKPAAATTAPTPALIRDVASSGGLTLAEGLAEDSVTLGWVTLESDVELLEGPLVADAKPSQLSK